MYTFDARTGELRQQTHLNETLIGYDFGEVLNLSWTRTDGKPGYAKLHLPPARLRGETLPPVVMSVYPRETLLEPDPHRFESLHDKYLPPLGDLLMRGFAVVDAAIPIRTGGGACADVAKNVELALDAVLHSGRADASRAGLIGFSFGGWTVNYQCAASNWDRSSRSIQRGDRFMSCVGDVDLPLLSEPCGIAKRLKDVFALEIRIIGEDFLDRPTSADLSDNHPTVTRMPRITVCRPSFRAVA